MTAVRNSALLFLVTALAAVAAAGAAAPQTSTDIWRMVPSNSIFVIAFDDRPDNPSIQAITNAMSPQAREQRAREEEAIHKAIEDFATLFGMSLDFAKDISSWAGPQKAFVVFPAEVAPEVALIIESKDADAANAALRKIIDPWGRMGRVAEEPDPKYSIVSFKSEDGSCGFYASASGSVVALASSKSASCRP